MKISDKLLSDPYIKWVSKHSLTETMGKSSAQEVYLVGGCLRDFLCGVDSRDRDFVLKKNAKSLALKTAQRFKGTFIEIKRHGVYRVVIKEKYRQGVNNKKYTILDFTGMKGSIEEDLKERDFTVNAVAWSKERDIIDPYKGCDDLNKKILRAVRLKNMLTDSLRMLRAYRIACEHGLSIDKRVRRHVRRYYKKIDTVSRERITDEMFKLLNNKNCVKYLKMCYEDKLLGYIFKRDVKKGSVKFNYNLSKKLKELEDFDSYLEKQLSRFKKTETGRQVFKELDKEFSQGLSIKGLLRLKILLNRYPVSDTEMMASRVIHRAMRDINRAMVYIKTKDAVDKYYRVFISSGEMVFETAILFSWIKKTGLKRAMKMLKQFEKIKARNLIDGNDIQRILNRKRGRIIGKIIASLKEEQFEGRMVTKAQAKRWIISNFT
jgi:tRNA nucleotidyltransferase/poly(A) polymerase